MPHVRPQTASAARSQRPWLLLLLDGVAYERMRGLYDAGHFRRFRPPARLISVFPTLTDPAYDHLFGTGPSPGYEAGGFDRRRNRRANGFLQYLRGANEAWARHVDYRLSFFKDAVMYLLPRWVYHAELRRARQIVRRCLAAGRHQVAIYILSTDGLGHMLTPAAIDLELVRLERWIEDVLADAGVPLDIVMLSDHGLSRLPSPSAAIRRFDLVGVLRATGLRVTRRLRGPGDVVVPLFGLLDAARLHTADAATRARAIAALRARPEIELVAARDGDSLTVYAGPASARIRCSATGSGPARYSYEPITGDPLQLTAACANLRAAGRMDDEGFADGSAWLAATAEAAFPAAPQRLWEGLFCLCREQPDLVASLNECWFAGSGLLSRFVRMQGTHGGLHRRATETFAMSTSLNLPEPLDLRTLGGLLHREFGWNPTADTR